MSPTAVDPPSGRRRPPAAAATAAALVTALLLALGGAGVARAATPSVGFGFSPAAPAAGQLVTFSSVSADADGDPITYAWDLDDDGVFDDGSEATASTTFTTSGEHRVSLQVSDPAGPPVVETLTVIVANSAPSASFTFSPSAPQVGADVTFTSTSSDPDGSVASTRWDLDNDGAFDDATGASATRAFPTAGAFTIRMLVQDNLAAETTASRIVTINRPPTASFSMNPSAVAVGGRVTFVSDSSDVDGQVASVAWDLDDDGRFDDGRTATVSRVYRTAGAQPIRLQVTDDRGATAVATQVLSVLAGQVPVAAFSFAPRAPRAGEPVVFTSASTDADGTIASLAWDLDADGSFDDAAGPTAARVFPAGGHIVRLRATDDRGLSSVAFQTVQVSGPIPTALATPGLGSVGPAPVSRLRGAVSGSRRLLLLSPFPVVHIRGFIRGGTVRVQMLSVRAGRGARIEVACVGRSCPVRRVIRPVRTTGRAYRFRALERRLRVGVVIEIRVTKPGRLGKYTRFALRRAAAPARVDLCMRWKARKPSRCPVQ
jgi:PKD repeat protein